jgi:phosphohistidine phosphatase
MKKEEGAMARRVYLMRHAKSSWKEPLPDHDRPLNKRGKKAAKRIGRELAKRGVGWDLLLVSTARRARATAKRLLRAMGRSPQKYRSEPRIYDADYLEIFERIKHLDDAVGSVLLIGHNPAVSDAAVLLSGQSRFDWLPTGAVAGLEFQVTRWEEIAPGSGEVILTLYPRELEE